MRSALAFLATATMTAAFLALGWAMARELRRRGTP